MARRLSRTSRTPAPPRKKSVVPKEDDARGERLQKVLAAAGVDSRRKCEELIVQGRVTVDGVVVDKLGTRVDTSTQSVELDGEKITQGQMVYWFLNKPAGVLSTTRDTHGRPTVVDLLPRIPARVYPVGRLDEDSTGLMLLTNDGPLADRLTHPRYGVDKTYQVQVAGRVGNDALLQLRKGIWLSDGRVRAHAVRRLGSKGDSTTLEIVLREGHNREIRRMFARFGHKVMRLERIAIGPIKLRKLRKGQTRPATASEVAMLRRLATPKEDVAVEEESPQPKSQPTKKRVTKRVGSAPKSRARTKRKKP